MKPSKKEKRIQDKIKKDIGDIKYHNQQRTVNGIVSGLKQYYSSSNYSEEDLFHRISKIESRLSSGEVIVNAGIGWFLGLILGAITVDDGTYISFGNPIGRIILTILFIFSGVATITYIINLNFSKEKSRTKYLDKKEIDIIEGVIEGSNKYKLKRTRFRRTY